MRELESFNREEFIREGLDRLKHLQYGTRDISLNDHRSDPIPMKNPLEHENALIETPPDPRTWL
jgi:hypothetical protein